MTTPYRLFIRMNGWVALILLGVGLGILAMGAYDISKGQALIAQEVKTMATLTRKHHLIQSTSHTHNTYDLSITYDTPSGQIKATSNATPAFFNSHKVGDQFEVFYLPDTPNSFEYSKGATAQSGWSIALTGGLVVLVSLFLLRFFYKRAARAVGLLRHGRDVTGKITELETRKGRVIRLNFVFKPAGGAAVMGASLSKASKKFSGLAKGQDIAIVYDPTDPNFAFWRRDLEMR